MNINNGTNIMLSELESRAYANKPYIIALDAGRMRVFQPIFHLGGWTWRALPIGPQHSAIMAAVEARRVKRKAA